VFSVILSGAEKDATYMLYVGRAITVWKRLASIIAVNCGHVKKTEAQKYPKTYGPLRIITYFSTDHSGTAGFSNSPPAPSLVPFSFTNYNSLTH